MIKTLGVLAAGLLAAQAPQAPQGPVAQPPQGGPVVSSGSGSCNNCGGAATWEWSNGNNGSHGHGGGFLHGLRSRLHGWGNSLFGGGHGHNQGNYQTGGCCGDGGAITPGPVTAPPQQKEPPLANQAPKAMPSGPIGDSPNPPMPEPNPSAQPTPGASPAPIMYNPPAIRAE